ncbi:ester cyclase [Gordoniibacillus kamchatkensis]|uniref:ester cyclase n=1 Tax=Gordoniibacillus kamchatkensis TaxID=1590651 RepID=UPI000B21BAB5|nr:ester cyclase [Paenibacillus sp. VKM B-2647]
MPSSNSSNLPFTGNTLAGKTVKATQFRQFRVKNGKIAEQHGCIDMATMWRQIRGNYWPPCGKTPKLSPLRRAKCKQPTLTDRLFAI